MVADTSVWLTTKPTAAAQGLLASRCSPLSCIVHHICCCVGQQLLQLRDALQDTAADMEGRMPCDLLVDADAWVAAQWW
jgi:hypothetical protein